MTVSNYATLDIAAAYAHASMQLGNLLDQFLDAAPEAILNWEFQPCVNLSAVEETLARELERNETERKGKSRPLREAIRDAVEAASVYGRRQEIALIEGTVGIFILRVPTMDGFNRARRALLYTVESWNLLCSHQGGVTFSAPFGITILARDDENFYDVQPENWLNPEAWIGFDFRAAF